MLINIRWDTFIAQSLVVFVVSEVCSLYLHNKPEGERKERNKEIQAKKHAERSKPTEIVHTP